MEFTRRKVRGQNRKVRKTWFDESGNYRIVWRREAFGVAVTPGYYSCVRCINPSDGFKYWNFCGKHGTYRKLNTAIDAAEKNRKMWEQAIEIANGERTGRADRFRVLEGRYGRQVLRALPIWVQPLASSILMNTFFPRSKQKPEEEECDEPLPSEPTSPSLTTEPTSSISAAEPSDSLPSTPASGPALNAEASGPSTTPTTLVVRSKETNTETESSAPSASERAAAPRKRSKRPTKPGSKTTARKRTSTKRSSKRVAKPLGS